MEASILIYRTNPLFIFETKNILPKRGVVFSLTLLSMTLIHQMFPEVLQNCTDCGLPTVNKVFSENSLH